MEQACEQLTCDYMHVHEEIVKKVTAEMPSDDLLFDLSELFKVFGDSTRIRILYCLLSSEMCVCDIATLLHMTQSAISHQLSVLKKTKLIKNRRDGKTIFYALADSHVSTMLSQGVEHVTE
ncbi:MAG: metalloregulator ArsR/SmtB family transcription factor [Clostridia bacterium]